MHYFDGLFVYLNICRFVKKSVALMGCLALMHDMSLLVTIIKSFGCWPSKHKPSRACQLCLMEVGPAVELLSGLKLDMRMGMVGILGRPGTRGRCSGQMRLKSIASTRCKNRMQLKSVYFGD